MPEPRDTADRLVNAFNAGDETALADLLAEDVTLDASGGVRRRGVGAAARYLMSWVNGFPGCRAASISQLVEGDRVVQVVRFEGTHTATLEGQGADFAATGLPLDLQMVWIGRYQYGLAVALQLYYDRLDVTTQLGLTVRQPAAAR
jgi:hypothetical protein